MIILHFLTVNVGVPAAFNQVYRNVMRVSDPPPSITNMTVATKTGILDQSRMFSQHKPSGFMQKSNHSRITALCQERIRKVAVQLHHKETFSAILLQQKQLFLAKT